MATILPLVCMGLIIVGAIFVTKNRPSLGGTIFMCGVFLTIIGAIFFDENSQSVEVDRKSRTVVVFGAVIEIKPTPTKYGCVQTFTITRTPYVFDIPCNTYQPTEAGDVMLVKFIQPKNTTEKPELLEFYNLRHEIEEVHFYLPTRLEAPLAD